MTKYDPKYNTSRAKRGRPILSLTLSPAELAALDRLAALHPKGSRSAVVGEMALRAVEQLDACLTLLQKGTDG